MMKGFKELAQREIDRASRYGRPFSLAYLDLDTFRAVNGALVNGALDELLIRMSEIITRSVRKTDVAARVGGDEFVVLFPETGPELGRRAVTRLKTTVATAMQEIGWAVTLSVGLMTFLTPPGSVDEMVRTTDDLNLLRLLLREGEDEQIIVNHVRGGLDDLFICSELPRIAEYPV